MTGYKGYLTTQETAAILRWARDQLLRLRDSAISVPVEQAFYENLIAKLEGSRT